MPFDPTKVVLARTPMVYDHRDFRLSDYITPEMRRKAAELVSKDWDVARILDQGSTPHCVGYAWAGFGISLPVFDDWKEEMGEKIYYQAKVYDGEPNQENGSSTRSGVRAFMDFGHLEANTYAFATSIDDIITWVLTMGPVITGTDWYDEMFYPDENGIIRVGGYLVGGHEWMICGVDRSKALFHCVNSWGTSYAIGGKFYIGFSDYEVLFNNQGDAVTALEVVDPIPPPPSGCMPLSSTLYKLYQLTIKK